MAVRYLKEEDNSRFERMLNIQKEQVYKLLDNLTDTVNHIFDSYDPSNRDMGTVSWGDIGSLNRLKKVLKDADDDIQEHFNFVFYHN